MEKERAGLGQRIQQLNNEYLLEAMTNAGLGDSHWADGSQVRPVLRLRRAVANIRRADKTRITETDEARNPRFYAR